MKKYALYLSWVVALAGLLVSLYFGEVLDMEPCRLCWYQRICLFPLVLFLGIAVYKNEAKLALYSLPLAVLGSFFAVYQSLIQIIPSLQVDALCGHTAHCTLVGPLPFLSALGFIAISLLIFLGSKKDSIFRK